MWLTFKIFNWKHTVKFIKFLRVTHTALDDLFELIAQNSQPSSFLSLWIIGYDIVWRQFLKYSKHSAYNNTYNNTGKPGHCCSQTFCKLDDESLRCIYKTKLFSQFLIFIHRTFSIYVLYLYSLSYTRVGRHQQKKNNN